MRNLQNLEIVKLLVVSTAHLAASTRALLDEGAFGARVGDYGWVVGTSRIVGADAPEELFSVSQLARQQGCTYVMFDEIADLVEGLQVYA